MLSIILKPLGLVDFSLSSTPRNIGLLYSQAPSSPAFPKLWHTPLSWWYMATELNQVKIYQ